MKNKLLFVIYVIMFGMSIGHAGGLSPSGVINYFHYYRGHAGLLIRQPVMVNPDSCERYDLYMLPKDHPYYKELVALIMASHLSGQSLTLYVDGCTQGMPTIAHVESFK